MGQADKQQPGKGYSGVSLCRLSVREQRICLRDHLEKPYPRCLRKTLLNSEDHLSLENPSECGEQLCGWYQDGEPRTGEQNRAIDVRTLQVTGLRNQGENSHGHRICLVSNCWPEAPT